MTLDSLERLIQRWKKQNTQAVAIPDPDDVRRAFADAGSRATPDVVAMYQMTGGMDAMDDEGFRLWSLADIRREGVTTSGAGVTFADYMIECWIWRLSPVDAHRSAVYVDTGQACGPLLVAESVEAFFDAYAANPDFLGDFPV